MAAGRRVRSLPGMRNPPLALAAGALAASYIAGAFIANATGIGSLADAAANGTKLSAPSFIIVLELLAVVLLARGRRGELILLPLSGLSIVAAMFDGDVGYASLSTGQVAWQVLEVGLSFIVFALAAAAVTRRSRRPVAAAGA
jgi:hypothetical protein